MQAGRRKQRPNRQNARPLNATTPGCGTQLRTGGLHFVHKGRTTQGAQDPLRVSVSPGMTKHSPGRVPPSHTPAPCLQVLSGVRSHGTHTHL